MKMSIQEYAGSIFLSFLGVIAFLSFLTVGICVYQLWATRGFYTKDFERLSREAEALSRVTLRVRKNVDMLRRSMRKADLGILEQAEEWDNGIRIALNVWGDIMEQRKEIDIEAQKGSGQDRQRRKSHGRYVIEVMRGKAIDGLERRKELTYPLYKMLLGIKFRNYSTIKSKQSPAEATEIAMHQRELTKCRTPQFKPNNEKHEVDSKKRPGPVKRIPKEDVGMPSKVCLGAAVDDTTRSEDMRNGGKGVD